MEKYMSEEANNIIEDTADEEVIDPSLVDAEDISDDDLDEDLNDEASGQEEEIDDEASEQDEAASEQPDEQETDAEEINADEKPAELSNEVVSEEGFEATVESVVEAILFASDEPLTVQRLVSVLETGSVKQVRLAIKTLNDKYKETGSAFRIEQIAGGYQMMTLPAFNYWLKKLLRVRTDNKLSPAALETLAVVSYKQPVIRADVEAIRGVASGEVLRNLMYKGLVKMVGRAEVLGRPMLYGTTKKFLDTFGLNNIKDLPKIEELKKPEQ